jgi:hypothetical protein
MNLRDYGAAARNHVGQITRVSGQGVDAEVVLEVQVLLAQPVVIAKDTAFGHGTVLLAAPSEQTNRVIVSTGSSAPAVRETGCDPCVWLPTVLPGHQTEAEHHLANL